MDGGAAAPVLATERRRQVMIGPLPGDFLRIAPPAGAAALVPGHELRQAGAVPVAPFYYASFIPANTRGRLSVTVVEAKLTKNYGLVKMDPYCRLRIGHMTFETPTHMGGGKTPRWSRTVHCYLPNGVDTVYLEIFDEKAFTNDDRVAWCHIPIPEAVIRGETLDEWYCLSGQQGDEKEGMINIVLSFTPTNALQNAQHPGAAPQHPPQLPLGPSFTDADIKELKEMFPNMDEELIKSLMTENGGNKDATVNALLSLGSD